MTCEINDCNIVVIGRVMRDLIVEVAFKGG
jgi:hypothetical protein